MADVAPEGLSPTEFEGALRSAYPVVVRRLALRYRDPQLAEEIAWDSLTRAFEVWHDDPHYFDGRNLTEWSSRLAGWRALDRLRDRARHPSPPGDPFDGEGGGPRAAADWREAERREGDRRLVADGLQRLDPADRDLLLAFYYDGRPDQDVGAERYADGTATARGLRVWRRRQKAQARLREQLREAGYEPGPLGAGTGQAL